MEKSTFLASYAAYQLAIRQVIQRLEKAYETVISPENANAGDAFPAHGTLEGLTFHFHGLGCTAILEGQRVEWDWLNVN
nr:hypothetical protein [Deinococcus misasensis]